MRRLLSTLVIMTLIGGCTIDAHRRNTLCQIESVAELRNREVVNNLALLSSEPTTLPAYSTIYSGVSNLQDSIQASPAANWASVSSTHPFHLFFFAKSLDITGSRQITQNWALDPMIVPEKLRALRAVCCIVLEQPPLEDDYQLLGAYDPSQPLPPGKTSYYFNVLNDLDPLLPANRWLHQSCCRRDIPKCACYVGERCGNYVWVEPDGVYALSEFTLVVQKIARTNLATIIQPPESTTTVAFPTNDGGAMVYFDSHNLPSSPGAPAYPVKARLDNFGATSELKAVITASKSQ